MADSRLRPNGGCEVTLPYDNFLIAGVRINRNHAEIKDTERRRAYSEEDPVEAWHQG